MVSSCCGLMSLQKAGIISGSVEVILAAVFLLYNAITLSVETPLAAEERRNAVETPDPFRFHSIRVVLAGLNALFWIGCLFLGAILIAASKQRDLRRLRSWFILTCILTVLFVVSILMEAFCMCAPALAIISPTVGTVLQCYMLWIGADFMEELTHGYPIKSVDIEET